LLKTICNRSFEVVDTSTYPYGNGCFDEEEPIHADWCQFGAGHIMLDIGASFGAFTLPALSAGASVVAFEPSDDGARILEANVRLNGWQERCSILRCAIYDGSGGYPHDLQSDVFGRSYPTQAVTYSTLDAEVGGRVDAIKIDVEGGELGVLRGGEQLLRRCRPALFIEDHDGCSPNAGCVVSDFPARIHSRQRIVEMLTSMGYSVERRMWNCNRSYLLARA